MTLPDNWEALIVAGHVPDADRKGKWLAVKEKMERLKLLYLEGDIPREEYEAKRTIYLSELRNLTDESLTVKIAIGTLVQYIQEVIRCDDRLIQKKLLRALLSAVILRGIAPVACEANSAFYPLLQLTQPHFSSANGVSDMNPTEGSSENLCNSGSDGHSSIQK